MRTWISGLGFAVAALCALAAGRMIIRHETQLLAAAAIFEGVQLAFALHFLFRLRRASAPSKSPPPRAAVLVPVSGDGPPLEPAVRSILGQDYPGEVEYVFVAASDKDPGLAEVERLLKESGETRGRVLPSGARARRASERCLSLAHALERVPDAEIIAVAGDDVRVPRSWLRELAAPLGDPGIGCACAVPLPEPRGLMDGALRRLISMGPAFPFFAARPAPCGRSMALTRKALTDIDAADQWRRSASEDSPLGPALKRAGLRVAYAPAATPACLDRGENGSSSPLDLCLSDLRVHAPAAWAAAGLGLLAKLAMMTLGGYPVIRTAPFLTLLAGEAALLFVVFLALAPFLRRASPEGNPGPGTLALLAAAAAPAAVGELFSSFLRSLASPNTLRRGVLFRVRGPGDAVALPPWSKRPRRTLLRFLAVFGSGLIMALSHYAGPHAWLYWIAYVPLIWVARDSRPKAAFFWGWLFGATGWIAGSLWAVPGIREFVPDPLMVDLLVYAALFGSHGIMCGIFAWSVRVLHRALAPRLGSANALMLAAVPSMVALESLFPNIVPCRFANTQYFHLPTVQSLELFGLAGITWLVMGFNAAAYAALRSWWRRRSGAASPVRWGWLALFALLALVNEGYGRVRIRQVDAEVERRLRDGDSLKIGLVQGNLNIVRGFDLDRFLVNLGIQNGFTETAIKDGAELVVWSESAYTDNRNIVFASGEGSWTRPIVEDIPLEYALALEVPHTVPMVLGAHADIETDSLGRTYNIAFLVDAERNVRGVAAKRHLFPFGEYMPLSGTLPALNRMFPNSLRLTAGSEPGVLRMKDGTGLGITICYEDVIPEHTRALARLGAHFLVNMTNDSSFRSDMAMRQHMYFAALRSIETRKYLVRAVNSGVSAVVDPAGRVVRSLGTHRRGAIVHRAARMDLRTLHVAVGDLFYHLGTGLFALTWLLALAWRPRRP